jgi:hypothetical protein
MESSIQLPRRALLVDMDSSASNSAAKRLSSLLAADSWFAICVKRRTILDRPYLASLLRHRQTEVPNHKRTSPSTSERHAIWG